MQKKDGGPAFPSVQRLELLKSIHISEADKEVIYTECRGASLRDWFAAEAKYEDLFIPVSIAECVAYIGLPSEEPYAPSRHWPRVVAKARYEFADAMLAERDK